MYKNSEKNEEVPRQSENVVNNSIIEPVENSVVNDISVLTTVEEEKVSPNATLILKKHYAECDHTIKEYATIPEEFVNLTEDEISKGYEGWQVESFAPLEVVLIKEEQGFCNQHYVLKEAQGVIAIYKVNRNGEETLEEMTGIYTEYLTENDRMEIEKGIKVYGMEELNSVLENYE